MLLWIVVNYFLNCNVIYFFAAIWYGWTYNCEKEFGFYILSILDKPALEGEIESWIFGDTSRVLMAGSALLEKCRRFSLKRATSLFDTLGSGIWDVPPRQWSKDTENG